MRRAETRATGARLLMVLFISVCLFLLAIPTIASSPDQQCVTAPVQKIAVPIYNHCGCRIGTEIRAPKRGEAGFKLCQCSAKRAAKAYTSESKPTLYTAKPQETPVSTRPKVSVLTAILVPDPELATAEPLIPPPNRTQV